jgi:Protein of unknown function (DUF3341)
MRDKFVVATYSDPDSLLRAVRTLRENDFRIYDVYAPYPVHGLDHAMGVRRTRLPLVTLAAGASALLLAICFQFYTSVLDWPLNVGGKPDNSTLAFVPICFEATVLIGGLSTFAALLFRARLFPGKKELLPAEGLTNDKFALVLRKRPVDFDPIKATRLMKTMGADQTWEFEGKL